MATAIDEVKANGIVSRDELLAKGCAEEKTRYGRKAYSTDGVLIALECTSCENIKTEGAFTKKSGRPFGKRTRCKKCERLYVERNKERIAEYKRKYSQENSERIKVYRHKYWVENKGELREWHRNHYLANKEDILDRNQEWRHENRERVSVMQREYYRENRGYVLEQNRKYREANPERVILAEQRRRARKRILPDDETFEQRTKVWADFGNVCALTGDSAELQADHAIPLFSGHGGTTYGNMYPLIGRLNFSKNASHIFEWFDANADRFGLSRVKFDALIEYLAEANEMTTQEYRKYVDWCFDNPRIIDEATGELVFESEIKNEKGTIL